MVAFRGSLGNFNKKVLSLVLLGVFLVSFFCASSTEMPAIIHAESPLSVAQHHNGVMTVIDACCTANLADHLSFWKDVAVGVPQFLQYLIAFGAVLLLYKNAIPVFRQRSLRHFYFHRFIQYVRNKPEQALFDALKMALRKGIIHAKIFPA